MSKKKGKDGLRPIYSEEQMRPITMFASSTDDDDNGLGCGCGCGCGTGDGSNKDNCMSESVYWELCSKGELDHSVYVCGKGMMIPEIIVTPEGSGCGCGSGSGGSGSGECSGSGSGDDTGSGSGFGSGSGCGCGSGSESGGNDVSYSVLNSSLFNSMRKVINTLIEQGKIRASTKTNYGSDVYKTYYDPNGGNIYVAKDYSADMFFHELIHYFQAQGGILDYDRCSSNNEFEAYFFTMIFYIIRGWGSVDGANWLESTVWEDFRNKTYEHASCNESGSLWIDHVLFAFFEEYDYSPMMQYFRNYWKSNSKNESYYKNYDDNYRMNWKYLFDCVGVKIKND